MLDRLALRQAAQQHTTDTAAGGSTAHVTASTPAAHPSIPAHLRIGRQQDAGSGPCSLRLLSPDESYDIINCLRADIINCVSPGAGDVT
jgi:hypothetical protein